MDNAKYDLKWATGVIVGVIRGHDTPLRAAKSLRTAIDHGWIPRDVIAVALSEAERESVQPFLVTAPERAIRMREIREALTEVSIMPVPVDS